MTISERIIERLNQISMTQKEFSEKTGIKESTRAGYKTVLNILEKEDFGAKHINQIKISDAELEAIFDAMFPIDTENDSNRKIENIKALKANLFTCYGMPDISQYRNTVWGVINAATDLAAHVAPARKTSNYQENNWEKIMTGHPFVDALYNKLAA